MKQTQYKNLKVFYREGTADEDVLNHSFDKDIFFSSIPYYKVKHDAVVIDVGAHIGTFSLLLAHLAPDGKIFALEPAQDTYDVLEKNVVANNLGNRMIPVKAALFNTNGSIQLFHDEQSGNWGHSIVSKLSNSYEEVETITLDTFFERNQIKKCDLIKFNCEGAEFKIIKAASDKVINSIDTWIILFHEDLETEASHPEIIERLKQNGFRVNLQRMSEDNKRGWIMATKSFYDYYLFSLKSKFRKLFR